MTRNFFDACNTDRAVASDWGIRASRTVIQNVKDYK